MSNKPTFEITPNSNASASGVTPRWDGTYLFDNPLLYFDLMYPGNVSHSGGEKPRILTDIKPARTDVKLDEQRIKSYRAY